MTGDEEYERVKAEIGWHATAADVWLVGFVIAVVWLLGALL